MVISDWLSGAAAIIMFAELFLFASRSFSPLCCNKVVIKWEKLKNIRNLPSQIIGGPSVNLEFGSVFRLKAVCVRCVLALALNTFTQHVAWFCPWINPLAEANPGPWCCALVFSLISYRKWRAASVPFRAPCWILLLLFLLQPSELCQR